MRSCFGDKHIAFFTSLFFGISVMSCQTAKQKVQDASAPGTTSSILYYDRGPCYGQCPVYSFYLLSDHSGLIEVKANFLEPGWYEADLDEEEIHALLSGLNSESIWSDDLKDEPEIADLPHQTLKYHNGEFWRMLSVQSRISDELSQLFQAINHQVQNAIWTSTTRRPAPDPQIDPVTEEERDVIVLLKPGTDVNAWMKSLTGLVFNWSAG